jgi:FdhD protein
MPDPLVSSPALMDASVLRLRRGEPGRTEGDRVAVEAPLELRLGGQATTVLMRTPGDDEELVSGFLFSEGLVARPADIAALLRPPALGDEERGNVIVVELSGAPARPMTQRFFYSSSSCGVCGKNSLEALAVHGEPSASGLRVRREVLAALPQRMREAQRSFLETGGLHASGLFTAAGELVALREDVGRHNALDKLIGWAFRQGKLPLSEHVLLLSGRISYELIQKAVAAGLPVVAAVGAPSSLAVELAHRFAITLVGFLRADSMNVYARAERVTG